jgi:hypothetical protein
MIKWFALVVVAFAACGGKDATPIDATADAPFAAEANCFDGLDDNRDGRPDCADPTCGAIAGCVAPLPVGWAGYAAVYDDAAASAPTCANPFTTDLGPGHDGLSAPAATCSACTCGVPSGGACANSGGAATVPAVTWRNVGVACASSVAAAIGCTGANVCQPRASSPFLHGLCIHQAGDLACPTGTAFTDRHVFFSTVTDTRGCTACACGPAAGGSCAPAGGPPVGAATEGTATTFCCMP